MRFTRLRLNGFKSFVDPTELLIADGLTGVVGPNGCGKSNLLEALRWVMGENRPTAMRGGGMEDVIFGGAARRPARGFAEVALTIDNTERLAPSGFNDSDILEVVRRITRDAGSLYKANAKEVRARDVQMLFADAATGATSPALVRQGQISELINAKPKSRRRILEDAAGIAGLYQRRHEAELKLNGAEQNLSRVDDVIEQLAQQLAALARQAKQAERYRRIGTDLRRAEGMLLYARWAGARDLATTAEDALRAAVTAAAQAERAALQANAIREETQAALPPLREEETVAAAILQRLLVEIGQLDDEDKRAKSAIATLEKRIAQIEQDRAREEGLNTDAGETLARLAEEHDRLTAAQGGHADRLAAAEEASRIAAGTLQAREVALTERTEDVARLAAQHQSADRLITETQGRLTRHLNEADSAGRALAAAREGLRSAEQRAGAAVEAQVKAQGLADAAEERLIEADEARAKTAAREAEARAARSAAESESQALRAEVAALNRLVERETGSSSHVLDALTVDSGYEQALGAALADDLRAPLLTGPGGSGWASLPDYEATQPLPEGVDPLQFHVNVPEALVRRLGQIGVVAPDQGAALQAQLRPGQRLVSLDGDLWRWDGFRAAAADAPSAAALRLKQLNRLVALKRDLEEVAARADGAAQAHAHLSAELKQRTDADKAAREARRAAETALAEASRAHNRAENDRSLCETRAEAAELAVARHRTEAEAAQADLHDAQTQRTNLPDLDARRAEVAALRTAVDGARSDMMAARSAADDLRRQGSGRERRLREVTKERETWGARLETAEARRRDLDSRQGTAEAELSEALAAPARIAERRDKLRDARDTAEERRKSAADKLAEGEAADRVAEAAARDTEKQAGQAREARAAAEARADAAREARDAAASRIREEQEIDPEDLLEQLEADPANIPAPEKLEDEILRLRRARDALGAVNLRAEEDAREVQTEHDTLVAEKSDLEEAIRTLRSGIASLNREGRERLLTAFEQVNDNFRLLFTHLFGGGAARLELVESDDPLDAGLEILCMPPGKRLSSLSLMSGGEQTLTAMALIFAVFLSNPSPICVLDEVDAPLDDANVGRFCDLLDEMTRRTDTRFLIITHHAITMSRMDRLFGVTMQEQGVSQLVSVDLKKAEQLVA